MSKKPKQKPGSCEDDYSTFDNGDDEGSEPLSCGVSRWSQLLATVMPNRQELPNNEESTPLINSDKTQSANAGPLRASAQKSGHKQRSRGSASWTLVILAVIMGTLLSSIFVVAIVHVAGNEKRSAASEQSSQSELVANIGRPIVSSGTLVKNVEMANVNSKTCKVSIGLASERNSASCPHRLTRIAVPADEEGGWPSGFSWMILKTDPITAEQSMLGLLEPKDVTSSGCNQFATDLCLDGDLVMLTHNSKQPGALDAGRGKMTICDQVVDGNKGFEFSVRKGNCWRHQSYTIELDSETASNMTVVTSMSNSTEEAEQPTLTPTAATESISTAVNSTISVNNGDSRNNSLVNSTEHDPATTSNSTDPAIAVVGYEGNTAVTSNDTVATIGNGTETDVPSSSPIPLGSTSNGTGNSSESAVTTDSSMEPAIAGNSTVVGYEGNTAVTSNNTVATIGNGTETDVPSSSPIPPNTTVAAPSLSLPTPQPTPSPTFTSFSFALPKSFYNSSFYNWTEHIIHEIQDRPTAEPTPVVSLAPTFLPIYNTTTDCYSITPFLRDLYCPKRDQKSFSPTNLPSSAPTLSPKSKVNDKCFLFGLYCNQELATSLPTVAPTIPPPTLAPSPQPPTAPLWPPRFNFSDVTHIFEFSPAPSSLPKTSVSKLEAQVSPHDSKDGDGALKPLHDYVVVPLVDALAASRNYLRGSKR